MSQGMLYIMAVFSIIGAIDWLAGNKLGMGRKFEEGFMAMGNFALSMLGIYSIFPAIAKALVPFLNFIADIFKLDPSIFLSSILACDMGGYSTAVELAKDERMVLFSGLILASTLGATISFTLPVATSLISDKDFNYFSKGILCGIITVPISCFVGGLLIGVPIYMLIINLIPIIILSVLIIVGLIFAQDKVLKIFKYLSKAIIFINIFGLLVALINYVFQVELIKGMAPIKEGFILIGEIAIILSGAYPLMNFLSRILKKQFLKLGSKIGIGEVSILGFLTDLTNSAPMLMLFKDMDRKGKVLNGAFCVSASFLLGGQFAFVSSISKETILPFLASKLVGGISAVFIANKIFKYDNIHNKKEVNL